MQRYIFHLPLALGLICAGTVGCLSDLDDLCQSDSDCPGDRRCVDDGGVKYCLAGTAGAGGDGGTGGIGGSGGDGGGGGVLAFEAELDVELVPNDALVAFLKNADRPVSAVAVHYETGGKKREVVVPLPEPSPLPLSSVLLRIPLATESESLSLRVEAHALRIDESQATFASAQTEAEISSLEGNVLSVELSQDPDFDFDFDTDPDATDCAPDNPDRHRGVKEICNGVEESCGATFCYLELDPGQTVRDLSCSTGERKCAAALANSGGESGTVRIYDPNFESPAVSVDGVSNPLGLEWTEHQQSLSISTEGEIAFADYQGDRMPGSVLPSRTFGGLVRIRFEGDFGIGATPGRKELDAFTLSGSLESDISCGGSGQNSCKTITLSQLSDGEVALHPESAILDARIRSGSGFPVMYLTFASDRRLGIVRVDDVNLEMRTSDSGLMSIFGEEQSIRAMTLSNAGLALFATGDAVGAAQGAYLTVENTFRAHGTPESFGLPDQSCPAALDADYKPNALLMADDCNGMLWELPLDEEGRPTGEDFAPHALEGCEKPFALASLPATAEEEAVTFIGCEGESHILVHGRY